MRYAISDIHGCYKTFNALLGQLQLTKKDRLYILGDLIDRGKQSWEVLKTVVSMPCECICLKGNHEDMMIGALEQQSEEYIQVWAANGGVETIRSIPKGEAHQWVQWMKKLPLYIELEDYFLVHANFSHGPNPFIEDDMLWSRGSSPNMGKSVISGHTPVSIKEIYKSITGNRRNMIIDNGCCFNLLNYDSLIAFCLDNKKIFIQKNIE